MGLTSLFTLTAATDLSAQSEPEVRVDAGIYSEALPAPAMLRRSCRARSATSAAFRFRATRTSASALQGHAGASEHPGDGARRRQHPAHGSTLVFVLRPPRDRLGSQHVAPSSRQLPYEW